MAENRQAVGGNFDPDASLDSILGGGTTTGTPSAAAPSSSASTTPPNRLAPIGPPVKYDASGVRLPKQSDPVPDGGYILTTFADGSRVKQSFAPGKDGGGWAQEAIAPDPDVAKQYQEAVDKHNATVAKQDQENAAATRSRALADQANARISETMPAQKADLEARAGETNARTADLQRQQDFAKGQGQGLTPSEYIAEQARLNQQAQFQFNAEVEKLRARVEQGKLDVEVAKAKAQEIQNDIANKLAASTQSLEASRIQSSERGQNMSLAGSLASTMGSVLNEERRTTVTPEEAENLAAARNWLANPTGPRPTFKANTTQLPSNSDKIAAMVNQILAPRSPTAAAAIGATPGAMVAPPPMTNVNTAPPNVSRPPVAWPNPQVGAAPTAPQGAPPIASPAPSAPSPGMNVPVWNNAAGGFTGPGAPSGPPPGMRVPPAWDDNAGAFVVPGAPAPVTVGA